MARIERRTACRYFAGELLCRSRVHRVDVRYRVGCAGYRKYLRRFRLRAPDDHHEQLVGADQGHRWPCSDRTADRAVAQAVRDVRRERGRYAEAEQPPRHCWHRHATPRHAESSMTMGLAQISPSTVNGMR